MSQKKKNSGAILSFLFLFLLGGAVGIFAASQLFSFARDDMPLSLYALHVLWLVLSMILAVYLQIILHEAGHLVFGLATGYRFVSFRIGSWMIQRENGRLRCRRMSLAGTGGQRLMAPPQTDGSHFPYKLYNFGGALMNLLAALASVGLAHLCHGVWPLKVLFAMQGILGFLYALVNGLPMQVQGVANDGRNALSLGKDPAAVRAFRLQLEINAQQVNGVALREMPAEWFELPDSGMDNLMISTIAVFHANRLMDEQRFAETAQAIDALEASDAAVLPLHLNMLLCDRLVCGLLLDEDIQPLLQRWNSAELRSFRKQMKSYPSVLRTEYAIALLVTHDEALADRLRRRFDKAARSHPYPAEAASERCLMQQLDAKAAR